MKVKDMRSNPNIRFDEIPVGTVVYLRTGLWIKVEPFVLANELNGFDDIAKVGPRNLIRLEDGLTARVRDDEIMKPVELEIEMHDYHSEGGDDR